MFDRISIFHNPGKSFTLSVLLSAILLTGCNTLESRSAADSGAGSGTSTSTGTSTGTGEAPDSGTADQKQLATDTGTDDVAATAADSRSAETDQPAASASLDGDLLYTLLAAEFAGNDGDVGQSLDFYKQAADELDDSRVTARAAHIALYAEDYDTALEILNRWQELEPEAAELTRLYAVTYLKMGQPSDAVPYIGKLLDDSDEPEIDETLGVKKLLSTNASTEDAYVVLQQLNAGKHRNKHLLVLQSRYAAQLKHYDDALAQLDQVMEIDPDLFEVLIIKARILGVMGKKQEATVLMSQVLEKLPENNALREQYARMLVEQGDLEKAVDQYGVLYENLPDNADIALSYALINIELMRLDEASETLQHLIEIDSKVPVSNYYLGRIAQNQEEDKQAVAYYLRVNDGEYRFDAQLRIGMLLARLGKPDEGLKKLEALGDETIDWTQRVKTFLAQGEILRHEKRYEEGLEMYSRALQQNRDDTNLLYARGLMAEKVDRLDITESDLLKVISKEPDNADALNALGYTLADRTSRYKEALDYIERAAELVPDDPAILDSLGWVSYRLGKMDEALKWLSMAFNKLEDAEIAAHYGEVLWFNGQKDKAREIWQRGKKQNADNPVLVETLERIKP